MPIMTMMDYIGVFAFALSGAYLAIQYKLDILGIFTLATVTACGGGITRDVVMDVGVPAFFSNPVTLYLIFAAIAVSVITSHIKAIGESRVWNLLMLVTDAIGLAVFAIATGEKAINSGYNLTAFLFVSTITAVGGGIIRDVMCQRIPMVLRKEVYASAAIAGSLVLWFTHPVIGMNHAIYLSLTVILVVRLLSVAMHWNLPTVRVPEDPSPAEETER